MKLFNFKRDKSLRGIVEPPSFDRLFVIAGPPACGKTTFIDALQKNLGIADLPTAWSPLFDDLECLQLMDVSKHRGRSFEDAILHVDLMQPFHCHCRLHSEALLECFTARSYEDWEALDCLRHAKELYFLTLFLPREELFRRFMNRFSQMHSKVLPFHMVSLYGDSSDESVNLKALYFAWDQYVAGFSGALHGGVDVSTGQYRYAPDFTSNLIRVLAGT